MQAHPGVPTPEGRWALVAERRTSYSFNPETPIHCILCTLPGNRDVVAVLNLARALFLCSLAPGPGGESRLVEVRGSSPAPATGIPTCLAFTPEAPDGLDLLVGMASGEVLLLSLATLLAQPSGSRPAPAAIYNEAGTDTPARCLSLQWIPGTHGASFVSTHADGAVLSYHRMVGRSSDQRLLHRSTSDAGMIQPLACTPMPMLSRTGAAVASMSPGGDALAVAGRDGVLSIHAYPSGDCLGGFKSYYGGLSCVAWSGDGSLVAAGGEDDLITVYSLPLGAIVAVGQGHSSWISQLAFDPCYRLASVGQDCQLLLWDIVTPLVPGLHAGHSAHSARGRGADLARPRFTSLCRADLPLIGAVAQQRMTADPLSSVAVAEHDIMLASYGGGIQRLGRTPPATAADTQ